MKGTIVENNAKRLAEEYMRLGGRRIAVVDDNMSSTRTWGRDTPEAERFWNNNVSTLDAHAQRDVESFLPSISDEGDEPINR